MKVFKEGSNVFLEIKHNKTKNWNFGNFDIVWINNSEYLPFGVYPIPGLHVTMETAKSNLSQLLEIVGIETPEIVQPSKIRNYYYDLLDTNIPQVPFPDVLANVNPKTVALQITQNDNYTQLYTWIGVVTVKEWSLNQPNMNVPNSISLEQDIKSIIEPNHGFHSKFHSENIQNNDLLLYRLDRNVFADPFELGRIDFGKGVKVQVFGDVDLEVPASSHLAKSHIVIVKFPNYPGTKSITLPFHYRYQDSSLENAFKEIKVEMPLVLRSHKERAECIGPIIPLAIVDAMQLENQLHCPSIAFTGPFAGNLIPLGEAGIEQIISVCTFIVSFIGVFVIISTAINMAKERIATKKSKHQ